MPPGARGTIVEVRVFNRRGVDKDARALSIEQAEIERLAKDRDDERAILEDGFYSHLESLLTGQTYASGPKDMKLKKGDKIKKADLSSIGRGLWRQIAVQNESRMEEIEAVTRTFEDAVDNLKKRFRSRLKNCSVVTSFCRA